MIWLLLALFICGSARGRYVGRQRSPSVRDVAVARLMVVFLVVLAAVVILGSTP